MTTINRILLIDDDKDDANLFCEALGSIDPSILCEFAGHGRDALEILTTSSKEKPHVIFLDLNMPVMNGWDCLQNLKKNDLLKDIPVVIYSTSTHQEERAKAFGLGAFGFITKPDRFTVLQSILSVLLTTPIDKWPSASNVFSNISFNEGRFSPQAKLNLDQYNSLR